MNSSGAYNTHNGVPLPAHLSNMGTRVNSQNRIISPTSSCNQYPHLKAENSIFNSQSNNKRSTQYAGPNQVGPPNVIPVSYGGNASQHNRSTSNQGFFGQSKNEQREEIQQRLSQYGSVVQSQPAQFKSVMSTTHKAPLPYGTTDKDGEPISVKGHLQDLEVSTYQLLI